MKKSIAVFAIIALLITSIPASAQYRRGPTGRFMQGWYPVYARTFRAFQFGVHQGTVTVDGFLQGSGGQGDFYALIVDYPNYEAYVNGQEFQVYWHSGRVRIKRFTVELGPGQYYLILSNQHSQFTDKSIWASVVLRPGGY